MSQLSIGIEIRKSDLKRDLASVRQILQRADRDIVTGQSKRAKNENAIFDKTYAQLRAKQAAHVRRLAAQGQRHEAQMVALGRRGEAARIQSAKRLEVAQLRSARAVEAGERRSAAVRHRIDQQRHNATMRHLREQQRAFATATRVSERGQRRATRIGERRAGKVMGVLGGTASMLGTGVRYAAGAAGLGAAALVGVSVSKQLDVQRDAAGLANQASLAGDPRELKDIQASVMQQAADISAGGGPDREKVIAGLRAFQEISGDLKSAQGMIAKLAMTADASDVELADLGRAAGIFSQQLQANGLQGKELETALDKVIRSGVALSAMGSVEFKDVATQAGKIASASGRVGGNAPAQAIIDAMALNQLAILGGAAGGDEAATATARFTSDIIKNEKKFNALGIKTRDETGGLNPLKDLAIEIANKTKGDLPTLGNLFDERGMKSIEFLAKVQRGDTSGLTGEQSAAAKVFKSGETSTEDIARLSANRREQADRKLSATFDQLYAAVGTQLVPVITNELVPALSTMIPVIADASKSFAKLVSWFAENPWTGLGAAVSAAMTIQIAQAGIGAAVRAALVALLAPSAVSALGLGGAGAAAGAAGVAGGGGLAALGAAGGTAFGIGGATMAGGALVAGAAAGALVGVGAFAYQAGMLAQEMEGISFKDIFDAWATDGPIKPGSQADLDAKERADLKRRMGERGDVSGIDGAMKAVDEQIRAAQKTASAAEALMNAASALGGAGGTGVGRDGSRTGNRGGGRGSGKPTSKRIMGAGG